MDKKFLYRFIGFWLIVVFLSCICQGTLVSASNVEISEGMYNIINVSSGKYLNAFALPGKDVNGTNVCVSNGDDSAEQKFVVESIGDKKYTIGPTSSTAGRLVDIRTTSKISDGANVQLWKATSYASKHWYFDKLENGNYVIRSVLDQNYVLTAVGDSHRSNVVVKKYTGSSLQQWETVNVSVISEDTSQNDKTLMTVNTKIPRQAQLIVEFAESKIGSMEYYDVSAKQNYCQRFARECYKHAGIIASKGAYSAREAYNMWNVKGSSIDNIPVGACIYTKGNSEYYHVLIYVGDGFVIHAISGKGVVKEPLSTCNSDFLGWGYHGGIAPSD